PRRSEVGPLLDELLGAAVVVDGGWEAALDAALDHPSAVAVPREGDRFGVTGWRIGTSATGATGHALDEARERGATAIAAAERAMADHQAAGAGGDEGGRVRAAAG